MRKGDLQLGFPATQYPNTKAAIEALAGVPEGSTAYATDNPTAPFGTYDGATWEWTPAPVNPSAVDNLVSFADIVGGQADSGIAGADVANAISASHAAVTLDADADTLLSLTGQELGLDTQAANTVLAGPATGADAVPTFRALVAADYQAVLPSTRLDDFDYDELIKYLSPIHAKNLNVEFAAGTYAHGVTAVANAYIGGVYSPTQNRIYLVPFAQSNQTNWHYIDCATGTVVAYAHGVTAVVNAYQGGVYSPTQNRIYLVPFAQANQTNWHYIDCATGTVVAYAHGVTAVANAYFGGVYSPTQNRIYLVPLAQSNQTNWHYVQEFSQAEISPSLMASALFNKF